MYQVFSDGCSKGNPGNSGWGVVIVRPDKQEFEYKGAIGKATNQIAELVAAIEGLSRIPEGVAAVLVSDSQYVLKGISEWRKGWESKGMKNSKGEIIANLELWKTLYAIVDARKVKTRWVKGHTGDKYNERCDQLANESLVI